MNKRDGSTQHPNHIKTNFLTNTKDIAVGTDFNRKLLVTQDWFYSQLYRNLLRQFYKKLGQSVPEEIETLLRHHDAVTQASFRGFDEPWNKIG